jgi:hypothetical protein
VLPIVARSLSIDGDTELCFESAGLNYKNHLILRKLTATHAHHQGQINGAE